MTADPFAALAENQMPAPVKARRRAAEKRRETLRKRREETAHLLTQRTRRERKEIDEALTGPGGKSLGELLAFLAKLQPGDAEELVTFVEERLDEWPDADLRHTVLARIDAAIVELRERLGLPPFDDPLPSEPANAFLLIRDLLT